MITVDVKKVNSQIMIKSSNNQRNDHSLLYTFLSQHSSRLASFQSLHNSKYRVGRFPNFSIISRSSSKRSPFFTYAKSGAVRAISTFTSNSNQIPIVDSYSLYSQQSFQPHFYLFRYRRARFRLSPIIKFHSLYSNFLARIKREGSSTRRRFFGLFMKRKLSPFGLLGVRINKKKTVIGTSRTQKAKKRKPFPLFKLPFFTLKNTFFKFSKRLVKNRLLNLFPRKWLKGVLPTTSVESNLYNLIHRTDYIKRLNLPNQTPEDREEYRKKLRVLSNAEHFAFSQLVSYTFTNSFSLNIFPAFFAATSTLSLPHLLKRGLLLGKKGGNTERVGGSLPNYINKLYQPVWKNYYGFTKSLPFFLPTFSPLKLFTSFYLKFKGRRFFFNKRRHGLCPLYLKEIKIFRRPLSLSVILLEESFKLRRRQPKRLADSFMASSVGSVFGNLGRSSLNVFTYLKKRFRRKLRRKSQRFLSSHYRSCLPISFYSSQPKLLTSFFSLYKRSLNISQLFLYSKHSYVYNWRKKDYDTIPWHWPKRFRIRPFISKFFEKDSLLHPFSGSNFDMKSDLLFSGDGVSLVLLKPRPPLVGTYMESKESYSLFRRALGRYLSLPRSRVFRKPSRFKHVFKHGFKGRLTKHKFNRNFRKGRVSFKHSRRFLPIGLKRRVAKVKRKLFSNYRVYQPFSSYLQTLFSTGSLSQLPQFLPHRGKKRLKNIYDFVLRSKKNRFFHHLVQYKPVAWLKHFFELNPRYISSLFSSNLSTTLGSLIQEVKKLGGSLSKPSCQEFLAIMAWCAQEAKEEVASEEQLKVKAQNALKMSSSLDSFPSYPSVSELFSALALIEVNRLPVILHSKNNFFLIANAKRMICLVRDAAISVFYYHAQDYFYLVDHNRVYSVHNYFLPGICQAMATGHFDFTSFVDKERLSEKVAHLIIKRVRKHRRQLDLYSSYLSGSFSSRIHFFHSGNLALPSYAQRPFKGKGAFEVPTKVGQKSKNKKRRRARLFSLRLLKKLNTNYLSYGSIKSVKKKTRLFKKKN